MTNFDPQEFLQDYQAEVSEHLKSIAQKLLALEDSLLPGASSQAALQRIEYLEDLLRSFHTIKGLSGMVGFQEAARLSHAIESLLRRMSSAKLDVDQAMINDLLRAHRLLQKLLDEITAGDNHDP